MTFRPIEFFIGVCVGFSLFSFYFDDGTMNSLFGIIYDRTDGAIIIPLLCTTVFIIGGEDEDV